MTTAILILQVVIIALCAYIIGRLHKMPTDADQFKALTARLKTANDALTKAVAENQPPNNK